MVAPPQRPREIVVRPSYFAAAPGGALILTRFPELKFVTCSWFAHPILNSLVIEQGGTKDEVDPVRN